MRRHQSLLSEIPELWSKWQQDCVGNDYIVYLGGVMIICHNCKGNGYLRLSFESEEFIKQCTVCHSQGELDESEHYHQAWSGGVSDEHDNFYWGPPLDPEGFKNYKIYSK